MVITEPPPDRPDPPDPPPQSMFVTNGGRVSERGDRACQQGDEEGEATSPSPNDSGGHADRIEIRRISSRRSSPQARRAALLANKNVREIEGGWLECWEEQKKAFYYFHPDSGSTQWEHPSNTKVDSDLVFRRKRFKFRRKNLKARSKKNSKLGFG